MGLHPRSSYSGLYGLSLRTFQWCSAHQWVQVGLCAQLPRNLLPGAAFGILGVLDEEIEGRTERQRAFDWQESMSSLTSTGGSWWLIIKELTHVSKVLAIAPFVWLQQLLVTRTVRNLTGSCHLQSCWRYLCTFGRETAPGTTIWDTPKGRGRSETRPLK